MLLVLGAGWFGVCLSIGAPVEAAGNFLPAFALALAGLVVLLVVLVTAGPQAMKGPWTPPPGPGPAERAKQERELPSALLAAGWIVVLFAGIYLALAPSPERQAMEGLLVGLVVVAGALMRILHHRSIR